MTYSSVVDESLTLAIISLGIISLSLKNRNPSDKAEG